MVQGIIITINSQRTNSDFGLFSIHLTISINSMFKVNQGHLKLLNLTWQK